MSLEVLAVGGLPDVGAGDDLGALIAAAAEPRPGDVVVVAQKVVSKAEGRVRHLSDVTVTKRAAELATRLGKDARFVQLVLDEAVRVVREERVLIVETRHGFICANAGIDHSNTASAGEVTLLPEDCDASARRIRDRIEEVCSLELGVIVNDTTGRPWRMGICDIALGVAGIPACLDLRGTVDASGRVLESTVVAVADQIAAAAGLLMQKSARIPVVVVRGLELDVRTPGTGRDLIRPAALDLFR